MCFIFPEKNRSLRTSAGGASPALGIVTLAASAVNPIVLGSVAIVGTCIGIGYFVSQVLDD